MARKQASRGERTDEKDVGAPAPSPSEGSHVSYGSDRAAGIRDIPQPERRSGRCIVGLASGRAGVGLGR